jgi:predicted AAA+ superfamily ATPase
MLAHAQGGLFNASQFGKSLGISYHSVQRYVDILERTFLLRRLSPYFRNVGKRLTKAPKLYLRDTGLLHHLLNINSLEDLENHPIRGASWETFVLEDLIRRERLRFPHSQCYFWRTQAGAEVDLVLDRGSERFAVEIKAGRGDKGQVVRTLEQARLDLEARAAWVVDQADGIDPVRPAIERRGFKESLAWLPN